MANAHERFMQVAMEEARRGAAEGNAAVGSVVVRDRNLIARGRNLVVTQSEPTAHAETMVRPRGPTPLSPRGAETTSATAAVPSSADSPQRRLHRLPATPALLRLSRKSVTGIAR